MTTEPSEARLRAWLLQRLPPEEAEPLEERLLADAAFGERVRDAETDLLDDLARGRLYGEERAIAAMRFAGTPRDRLRLGVARALARIADGAPASFGGSTATRASRSRKRRVVAGLLASAAAVLLAVVGVRRFMVAPPTSANDAVATVTLTADRQRGTRIETLRLPRGAKTLRLQAEIGSDDPAARYALTVEDGDRTLFRAADLVPRAAGAYRFVEVTIAADALGGGERRVRVAADAAPAEAVWSVKVETE